MKYPFDESAPVLFIPSPESIEDDVNTMLSALDTEEFGGDQVPLCEVRDMIEKLAVYAVNLHGAITSLKSTGIDVSHFILEGESTCQAL